MTTQQPYRLVCNNCGHEETEPFADGDECPMCFGALIEAAHQCFEIADRSLTVRVHGDPGMSDQTKEALMVVGKAAYDKATKDLV